ncbi:helix-turn-helix transcriptional regulator [Limimaricola hongkongensis]|uniref:Transcriptional regulator, LuxR family n=1 Tax=Limimaricola hongkongensis DSM 17492 TaxID=1122180 RepID=A0A017H9P9_9RHOB|nr:LuxR family transcriptional regulator [Limimaricola hongkongensis]EYD70499.1 transcriptional regulator, LuxR family [Limimaricola hongkongensis DSM 17492]
MEDAAKRFGPTGYYLGLRIRFAFPATEINRLPVPWIDFYTREKFFFDDPALRWSYDNTGAIRWEDLARTDPLGVVGHGRAHGLRHGAVAAYSEEGGLRSYGLFYRADRAYRAAELTEIAAQLKALHHRLDPPTTLTRAELEVLRRIQEGGRIKEIAWALGVSEGAIKQRLKNARTKLGAQNGTHAAALASGFGLI